MGMNETVVYLCKWHSLMYQCWYNLFCMYKWLHMKFDRVNRQHWYHIHHFSPHKHLLSMERSSDVILLLERTFSHSNLLPVQTTAEPTSVSTYPVLQVHKTALVFGSCEQMAFGSHPPFFTSQASFKKWMVSFLNINVEKRTGTDNVGEWSSIGVSNLASADDSIGDFLMTTFGIAITSTIFDKTWIWCMKCHVTIVASICNQQEQLTSACHIGCCSSIGITSFASTNNFICRSIMWTDSITITSTIFHFTSIYKHGCIVLVDIKWERENRKRSFIHTCTDDIGWSTRIGISSLASTDNGIRLWIMRADSIDIATTIVNQAGIYKIKNTHSRWDQGLWYLFTDANCIVTSSIEYIASFACTFDSIGIRIVWTIGIDVTSTVFHETCVYIEKSIGMISWIE